MKSETGNSDIWLPADFQSPTSQPFNYCEILNIECWILKKVEQVYLAFDAL